LRTIPEERMYRPSGEMVYQSSRVSRINRRSASAMPVLAVLAIIGAGSVSSVSLADRFVLGGTFGCGLTLAAFYLRHASRSSVVVRPGTDELVINNPIISRTVRWVDVARFELTRPLLGPSRGVVVMRTGSRIPIYGIAGLNATVFPGRQAEAQALVDALNARLAVSAKSEGVI
jgi:hypothetical protein